MSLGYAALSGKNSVEAVRMAVEDFKKKYGDNALGGPIEVITADTKNDAEVAKSEAQEFYDALFAQVKSKAESKEPFDYSKVISIIPADKASRPLSEANCKMTR